MRGGFLSIKYQVLSIKYVATLLATGALLLAPFAVQAADQPFNLQISPLPIELATDPGHAVSAELRVRNAGSGPERLQAHVVKVTEDDNGIVHLTEPGKGDDWASWISFNRKTFDAPANEWQTINMTVNVPRSAAFGYYFAVEFMRATAEAPQPGQAVARGAIATFVLLNANAPGAKREAELVSFKTDRKFYEFLPASFSAKIRATGNVHVAPSGNVFIMQGKKQIASVSINAAAGNILPNSSRFFGADWSEGFPHYETKMNGDTPVVDKNNQPVRSLKWDLGQAAKLRMGHYTAHLYMVYDNGTHDVPLEATVDFWVIPWRLIMAVIFFPSVALYLLYRNRRLRRELKKYRQGTK